MKANDGKMHLTDVATAEQLLRIIQSIPSPKAEPFKRWLARVGTERMEEEVDPQKAIDRARATYLAKGYPEPWIKARLQGIQARNELTDEWKAHGVQDQQYAILTNIIHRGTFDLSVREHKALKGLKKENLRDNMTVMKKLFKLDHVSFRTPCLTTRSEQEPSNWSLLRASYPRKRSLTHTPSSSARESL